MRWQGRSFVVLFKAGRRRVSPRLHLFVSDLNQRNKRAGCVHYADFTSITVNKLLSLERRIVY